MHIEYNPNALNRSIAMNILNLRKRFIKMLAQVFNGVFKCDRELLGPVSKKA